MAEVKVAIKKVWSSNPKPTAQASPLEEAGVKELYFDVIKSSLSINSPEQFCAWMRGDMQKIFPHGMMACGIGQIENQTGRIHQSIACNFPQEYFHALQQPEGHFFSPVAAEWIKTRRPVLFELSRQKIKSTHWLDNFRKFELENIVAHGQYDLHGLTTSYFMFSKIPGALIPRHAFLMELLVPHLHVALLKALQGSGSGAAPPELSSREHQVMNWISQGKTNWEITQVMCISENTVKNHVQRILIKLKVKTRAQAVSQRNNAGLFASTPP